MKIYTDGSHLKHTTGRLGIGGIIVDESLNEIDRFSMLVLPDYMKVHYGTSDVSNPTCEMLAALVALLKFEKHIKDTSEPIYLYADYQGVSSWMLGQWKIKAPYILRIKDDIDAEIKRLGLLGKIKFEWVRGHLSVSAISRDPNAYWNSLVDKLAKGE